MIGQLVDGRYRVRSRIARGGMATVYVATDMRLERRVALKVMHAHLSDDSVFQSRFIQEARSAARLADPHVVNVFDQGQDGEIAYLVMEYMPGITLRDLLKEQKRLTVAQTITVMDAVLSGLSAAHRAGLIHRDVKPENVLLAEDGRIKIGDFGLARATSANTATGAELLGTIAYLAPELVTRGTADARSDIYALGIMLYEMLTGQQPFRGDQPMQIAYQHATDSVPRPSSRNPGVPEQIDELVLWTTEKEPDERPSDAAEMLDRLRAIEQELSIAPMSAQAGAVSAPDIDPDAAEPIDETMVLPFSRTEAITDEILPDGEVAATGPQQVDNAVALRRVTERRTKRGFWLVAVVLLLSVLAGGAGWYWGSGPGSLVAVPDVAGGTFEEASAELGALGLAAEEHGVHSLDVESGTVIGTDPEDGSRIEPGSVVSVEVSLGAAEVDVPALPGMPQKEAIAALEDIGIETSEVRKYFIDARAGDVTNARIQPRDGGELIECIDGCTAHDGDTAVLSVTLGPVPDVAGRSPEDASSMLEGAGLTVSGDSREQFSDEVPAGTVIGTVGKEGVFAEGEEIRMIVSAGPVPDVAGQSVEDATKTLTDAGLNVVSESQEQYHDSVPEGQVIGTVGKDGAFVAGDDIQLIVSLGPEPVPVPDVAGMHRTEAIAALSGAGFEVEYNVLWNSFPNGWVVATGTDPGPGEELLPGETVKLLLDNTGPI